MSPSAVRSRSQPMVPWAQLGDRARRGGRCECLGQRSVRFPRRSMCAAWYHVPESLLWTWP
eukprot:9183448-Alexandrium_andersonii.AAC.1